MMKQMGAKFRKFKKEFQEDEGGMEIVQTVLLVLVAILAVVLVWGLLSNQLGVWWNNISSDPLSSGTSTTTETDDAFSSFEDYTSTDTSTDTSSSSTTSTSSSSSSIY